jgi:hypothetical protein
VDGLTNVIAAWRAPQRVLHAPAWRDTRIGMTDVQIFGETGLIAARRGSSGKPMAIAFGAVAAPRGSKGVIVGEVQPSESGTVALRGSMVPRCAFPAGVEGTAQPHFIVAAHGFIDTGYTCMRGAAATALAVIAPPPGLVNVGGYRFAAQTLQETAGDIDSDATLAALPDALLGQRMAGSAPDRDRTAKALNERGVNPLLASAFREPRLPGRLSALVDTSLTRR